MKKTESLRQTCRALADPAFAKSSLRFFKTGKGEYGEGDQFLGIPVPTLRLMARSHQYLPLRSLTALLRSPFHEERMVALFILLMQFQKSGETIRKKIYDLFLGNMRYINNWDLVDATAPHIIGTYLLTRSRRPLYRLAKSSSLWERRMAMVSTLAFIRQDDVVDTLAIADLLLQDKHDLIHKAVGWMLREVGKRSPAALLFFLDQHAAHMPRTTLRYAIERLSVPQRKKYLLKRKHKTVSEPKSIVDPN